MTIRVLLADDHAIVRRILRQLIEDDSSCEVCCEVADGTEAVRLAEDLNPDVVVLDISMPEMDGFEAAQTSCDAPCGRGLPRHEVQRSSGPSYCKGEVMIARGKLATRSPVSE